MQRLQTWIRNYFGFSRTETNAFLILLPLMVLLIFSEPAYQFWFVRQPQDFLKEKKELDSLIATWKWDEQDSVIYRTTKKKLFSFDPNRVSKEELMELGFNTSLASRIVNYRLKGGKFVQRKDLMKIYGMDSVLYQGLIPFIELPTEPLKENVVRKFEPKEKIILAKFDLNSADTTQLIKIYGIGSNLSERIVTYRGKLGGFVSYAQLKEIYRLDSTVIIELKKKSFIEENFQPKLININVASEQELAAHPYIKFKIAKAITAYRFQHGTFQSVEDVKKIALMDESKFQKIKPYLSINP